MKKIGLMLCGVIMIVALAACSTSQSGHSDHAAHSDHTSMEEPMMVHVGWKTEAATITAKQSTKLSIQVRDHENPYISKFDTVHEKKMHLIVVSSDLNYFVHLHPTYEGKGLFSVDLDLPESGNYTLFADFKPTGAAQHVERHTIQVAGDQQVGESNPLSVDTNQVKQVEGKQISFTTDNVKVAKETTLTFNLADTSSGNPITDLQPYLGATGHVVIISEDTKTYLHVHPMDESSTGPKATFMTTFPKAGKYKIFAQFQHNNRVFTVPYVIEVK